MKMRSGNSRVAIMANKDTLEKSNAEGSLKRSYVDVAASPRRSSRSKPATVPPSAKSGNDGVANPVEESKVSPPPEILT